jgi:inorganic pyrophosphatase
VTGKLTHDPDLEIFTARRALALGITYPFDWGVIPGTIAEDGAPSMRLLPPSDADGQNAPRGDNIVSR